ncbi:hypothetical protein M885DRAFT_577511 [Pelagophyceae sp. CCMP2097]|nr:hypothetical protein M885DRAFT_577511 [Pelagophyceae sp. CCMP2097]
MRACVALLCAWAATGGEDAGLDASAEALWRWSTAEGADVADVYVAAGASGRGLFSRGSTDEERVLFRLPRAMCLTASTAAADAGLCAAVDCAVTLDSVDCANFSLKTQIDVLALKVTYELLEGNSSFWHFYLAAVSRPSTPQYDVAEGLVGSPEGVSQILKSRSTRLAFRPSRYASGAIDDAAIEALELSSLVALWIGPEDGTALIPIWDLVNHASNGRISEATLRQGLNDTLEQFSCVLEWVLTFGFVPTPLAEIALQSDPFDKTGSCAEVAVAGRTFKLPQNEAELRNAADAPTLRNALHARLAELPTEGALRAAVGAEGP